jgi:hypothetical protein
MWAGWLAFYKGQQDGTSPGNDTSKRSLSSGGASLSEILIDIQYVGKVIHDVTSSECGRDAPH